ncbi:MAG TPA: phosphoglucomutase/phosphomannomutase family protein [Thermoanaerobaculia bacterium]|jgi:phosphomannomutase|nr:phosphoglucomutase/phosphomannomutase family protein [Thermoanaerobaculia bacterium]
MTIAFGTDGWRGVIAEDCTFAEIRRIATATARFYLGDGGPGDRTRIVVGHDPRFLSPEFARACAEVFADAGIDVLLSDRPIPTPAVSFHVRRLGLKGGVAITASHNPGKYNGFKVKAHFGGSAPPSSYAAIAAEADQPLPGALRPGRIEVADLAGEYRDRLAALVDVAAMRTAKLSVLEDAMHGAAGTLFTDILSGGTLRAAPFRTGRDPLFGGVHPEPIGANLAATSERVRREGFDLAVAQDGDADRLGVLDAEGRFVSPHQVLALLLLHVFRNRGVRGGIAKTFSTSFQVDRIARVLGAPLIETGIGFKYVAELMNRGEAVAGGEESGGYAFAFHLPERDGVLSALLLVESLATTGRTLGHALADLASEFGSFAYGRRDVSLPVSTVRRYVEDVRSHAPAAVAGERVTAVQDRDGVKYILGERGWLLHRLSGTEPLVRLYCEHEDAHKMEEILADAEGRLQRFVAGR